MLVDDIENNTTRQILLSSYGSVFESREPFWIIRETYEEDHLYVYECLILPLVNEHNEVIRLLSIIEYPQEP